MSCTPNWTRARRQSCRCSVEDALVNCSIPTCRRRKSSSRCCRTPVVASPHLNSPRRDNLSATARRCLAVVAERWTSAGERWSLSGASRGVMRAMIPLAHARGDARRKLARNARRESAGGSTTGHTARQIAASSARRARVCDCEIRNLRFAALPRYGPEALLTRRPPAFDKKSTVSRSENFSTELK